MFRREHHLRIAAVLNALDARRLSDCHCWFGGGTAIALRYGEFRESRDIDFLVSDRDGYRSLRQSMNVPDGLASLTRPGHHLEQVGDLRADQYGIRTVLLVAGSQIKFEIILEARIDFDAPGEGDQVCGVGCLSALDLVASKLLANSDRWRDDSVLSRDLIDLAMMAPAKSLLISGVEKASLAYGDSVQQDLVKAIQFLADHPNRLEQSIELMQMNIPRAVLWKRIKALGNWI